MNSEFAKKIEIRFLEVDKKSKTAEIQVTFPDVKKVINQENRNTESTFLDRSDKTGYVKLMLEVQVEESENFWKIVSPEVIDEAVIKNINEGFDMIAEELETIELGGEERYEKMD